MRPGKPFSAKLESLGSFLTKRSNGSNVSPHKGCREDTGDGLHEKRVPRIPEVDSWVRWGQNGPPHVRPQFLAAHGGSYAHPRKNNVNEHAPGKTDPTFPNHFPKAVEGDLMFFVESRTFRGLFHFSRRPTRSPLLQENAPP